MDLVISFDDPYPYFRGMVAEIGLPTVKLLYDQPARKFGITKNNWYTLYDIGMLGIINHSKVPLRLATFAGFLGAALSFLIAIGYLLAKIIFWSTFTACFLFFRSFLSVLALWVNTSVPSIPSFSTVPMQSSSNGSTSITHLGIPGRCPLPLMASPREIPSRYLRSQSFLWRRRLFLPPFS